MPPTPMVYQAEGIGALDDAALLSSKPLCVVLGVTKSSASVAVVRFSSALFPFDALMSGDFGRCVFDNIANEGRWHLRHHPSYCRRLNTLDIITGETMMLDWVFSGTVHCQ